MVDDEGYQWLLTAARTELGRFTDAAVRFPVRALIATRRHRELTPDRTVAKVGRTAPTVGRTVAASFSDNQ